VGEEDRTVRPLPGSSRELSREAGQTLLRIARQTLCRYIGKGELPEFSSDSPELLRPGATFVTLWRRDSGELRGCRGEMLARRPLIESVVNLAVAAATDDPRFPPVEIGEVSGLRIEINVLTPANLIRPEDIEIGRHGLMIVKGTRSALLLPEVPSRHGWGPQELLAELCSKAGLQADAWKADDAKLYGFETEVWGEEG
jgi:AmmeMemoRadiSam system protein A